MTEEIVKEYYKRYVRKEWNRLVKDSYHRLESDTTLHFLKKYLPKKGLILDAGGGPGRYTIELAKLGYDIVLLDIVPENLEFAKRQIKKTKVQARVKEVVEGSITDLSRFPNNTFDAVICLGGPLSHVIDKKERDKAISELIRVAKRNAPIFISVISRLGVLVNELKLFQHEIELPVFKKIRDTGDYLGGYGFTPCHFFLPEELKELFVKKKVRILEIVGLEGIGSHFQKEINKLAKNKKRWKVWLETHYKTCTHPAAIGISEHILIICKKL
ncbi:MAG: class I SAM-dependent methyltransferase [Candidatus Nanoarchaeia archaeon]